MYRRCMISVILIDIVLSIAFTIVYGESHRAVLRATAPSSVDNKEVILKHRPSFAKSEAVHRFSPLHVNDEVVDTLSWRILSETNASFIFVNDGDSAAIWFEPLAACTLKAIRIHFFSGEGTLFLDIRESKYGGHITTRDSTDANGWIGSFVNGQWIPGWVMGYPPLGEHIWGPFPFTVNQYMGGMWSEIPTHLISEPILECEPFFITIFFYTVSSVGISMESPKILPYHFFKYYAGGHGPDGVHDGRFIRSHSLWVEAIVSYCENTPPEITNMTVYSDTYDPGPYDIEANMEDQDIERPEQAGIAGAYVHWEINGISDSTVMFGPLEGCVFSGHIPPIEVGEEMSFLERENVRHM